MALTTTTIKAVIILGFSTVAILAFQNCSKVNFSEDQGASVFKGSSIDSDDSIIDPGVTEVPPSDEDEVEDVDVVDKDKGKDKEKDDESYDSLVECELISPKQKIILDQILKNGSNASATRVCMSEYACLNLINSYAAKRDCSLTLGASSLQDSEAQCTKIFPGSKGTCHNAGTVSDERVTEILDLMGKAN